MPDYDPKNIPTLDDIIEKDLTDNIADNIEKKIEDDTGDQAETGPASFDINLFIAKSTSVTNATVTTENEPQLGDIDYILDAEADDTEGAQYADEESSNITDFLSELEVEDDADNTESALIDYIDIEDEEDNDSAIDAQSPEPTTQVSVEPISVGLMVKDIVRQLMPDLEQQLVSLLQQAIEEKLPKHIIKSSDYKDDN